MNLAFVWPTFAGTYRLAETLAIFNTRSYLSIKLKKLFVIPIAFSPNNKKFTYSKRIHAKIKKKSVIPSAFSPKKIALYQVVIYCNVAILSQIFLELLKTIFYFFRHDFLKNNLCHTHKL